MWTLQVTLKKKNFGHKPCKKYAGQEKCFFFKSRIRIRDPILKFWFAWSGSGRKWTGSATLIACLKKSRFKGWYRRCTFELNWVDTGYMKILSGNIQISKPAYLWSSFFDLKMSMPWWIRHREVRTPVSISLWSWLWILISQQKYK